MNDFGDFVGRGWAFPVGVDGRGSIALLGGPAELEASIRVILATAPGERVMRPEFGCEIWELMFAPIDPNTLGLMGLAVRAALERWEPRIDLADVLPMASSEDAARVDLVVSYRVKATNDLRNLVFPFYTIPKEEAPSVAEEQLARLVKEEAP